LDSKLSGKEDERHCGVSQGFIKLSGIHILWLNCGFRRRRTAIPEGTRTAIRAEGEQISERSDAGNLIVQEVFGFVKENLSGA